MCGCGQTTTIASTTAQRRFQVKGEHVRYIKSHAPRGRKLEKSGRWKGGRTMRRGYVMLYRPEHPRADSKGYVPEHQLVAIEAAGRDLLPGEVVHHLNGVKDDNRPENLQILTASEHRIAHREESRKQLSDWHRANPTHASEAGRKGAAARWKKAA